MSGLNTAILAVALLIGTVTVGDPGLGFRFEVPDNFSPLPKDTLKGDVVCAYGTEERMMFYVERLRGLLPRPIPDVPMTAYEEHWGDFALPVTSAPLKLEDPNTGDDIGCVALTVMVPLAPEAILIKVIGEPSREDEMRQVLRGALASLEGESNWLTDRERRDRITVPIMWTLVAAIVLFVIWRSKRSRPPSRESEDPASSAT